jgi:hypothetical protein
MAPAPGSPQDYWAQMLASGQVKPSPALQAFYAATAAGWEVRGRSPAAARAIPAPRRSGRFSARGGRDIPASCPAAGSLKSTRPWRKPWLRSRTQARCPARRWPRGGQGAGADGGAEEGCGIQDGGQDGRQELRLMRSVRGIPADEITTLWPRLEPLISRALDRTQDYTLDDVHQSLREERRQIFATWPELDTICITSIEKRPRRKVLIICWKAKAVR